jgi:hypothetical protein
VIREREIKSGYYLPSFCHIVYEPAIVYENTSNVFNMTEIAAMNTNTNATEPTFAFPMECFQCGINNTQVIMSSFNMHALSDYFPKMS